MRSVVLCATFAALTFPSFAAAQPLPLTEAEALQRLSDLESSRPRDPRRHRSGTRRRARRRALAQSAFHVRSRIGGRQYRSI